jgi:hypothetical protein
LKYFFKGYESLPAETLRKIIFYMCSSTETLKEKPRLQLKARKQLRLVCKDWYECLNWNDLALKNSVFLKVCCFDGTSGKLSQRLESGINDELLQDESLPLVTMLFTPKRLEECKIMFSPNFLIIELGFPSLSSQFNLESLSKLMVIAKDEGFSSIHNVTEQLVNLLQSINSESLKTLIFDDMYITNENLQFLSRFSKLEYLGLPNCMIMNPNIHWEKFSSLKILTLTLRNLYSYHKNIMLHLDNEMGKQLEFDCDRCEIL